MKKHITLILVSLLLIVTLGLGACTKATPTTTTTTPKPTPSQPATSTATTTVIPATTTAVKPATTTTAITSVVPTSTVNKYGGTLKLLDNKPAQKFGFPMSIKGEDNEYSRSMLENLITFDDKANFIPHLATAWEMSPDGKTYTFTLRRGVKFHDGTDFNAQAVKFNLDVMLNTPDAGTLPTLKSVDVIDDYTVRLNLSETNNMTLFVLANFPQTRIISPTAVQKNGSAWAETNPVGTGPFMFKEFKKNVSLSMVRNPNYWQKDLPYLDGMQYIFIVDAMSALVSYKGGEGQILINPDTTIAAQLIKEKFTWQGGESGLTWLYGDSANPASVLADKRVRIAIEYALDKVTMCETIGPGLFTPGYQIISEGHPYYNNTLPQRKYDVTKAKQLLAEAGRANGFTVKFYANTATGKDFWVALQSYMKDVNIDMQIEWVNTAGYDEIRLGGKALPTNSMTFGKGGGGLRSSASDIYEKMTTKSGWYKDFARPAGFDAKVESILAAITAETEKARTQELAKMVYDDETVIPFYVDYKLAFYNQSVQDPRLAIGGMPNERKYQYTWLKTK